MKRFFTLLAAVLMTVPTLFATEFDPAPANTETKVFNLSGFDGLSVTWIYQVELSQAARHSVSVEAPDFVVPYLDVTVSGGVLKLGLKEVPRELRSRIENGHIKVVATVTMPQLHSLRMSGASKLNAKGSFSSHKLFDVELSGATNVQGLAVNASELKMKSSGAAKFSLSGHYDKMTLRLGGSVNGTMSADSRESWLELSGAAKLSNTGTLGLTDVRASGAAVVNLDGAVHELELEGSGASKLNSSDAPSRTAKIRLSGASKANIYVRDELSVSLSGASNLRYRAGDRLKITSQSVSRGSTISAY